MREILEICYLLECQVLSWLYLDIIYLIYKYADTIINSVMLIVRNKINKNVIHSDNKESLILF